MKPEYQSMSLTQAIAHLVEECGKTLAAAGKLLRFGAECYNPELPKAKRETNGAWLLRELCDLHHAIERVRHFAPQQFEDERKRRALARKL